MVIVKDMEMPDNCISCEFHGWSFKQQGIYCQRTGKSLNDYKNSRDADCPLEEYHGKEKE